MSTVKALALKDFKYLTTWLAISDKLELWLKPVVTLLATFNKLCLRISSLMVALNPDQEKKISTIFKPAFTASRLINESESFRVVIKSTDSSLTSSNLLK